MGANTSKSVASFMASMGAEPLDTATLDDASVRADALETLVLALIAERTLAGGAESFVGAEVANHEGITALHAEFAESLRELIKSLIGSALPNKDLWPGRLMPHVRASLTLLRAEKKR